MCESLQEGLHVMKLIKHLAHCMANSWHKISFITLEPTTREGHINADVEGQETGTGKPKAESGIISCGLHLVASSALLFGWSRLQDLNVVSGSLAITPGGSDVALPVQGGKPASRHTPQTKGSLSP